MMKAALLGGALTLALTGGAMAQSGMAMAPSSSMAASPGAPMTTPQYLMAASQSDEFEIQEGKLAEAQGKSARVRNFGAMMIRDHSKTTATLHAAIMKTGMAVPPPPPLRADQAQMISQLQQMSGSGFDKAYVMQQMQSHQEALTVQSTYAHNGDAPPIRMAATKAVPIVKHHIAMLEQMQGMMGQ